MPTLKSVLLALSTLAVAGCGGTMTSREACAILIDRVCILGARCEPSDPTFYTTCRDNNFSRCCAGLDCDKHVKSDEAVARCDKLYSVMTCSALINDPPPDVCVGVARGY